LTASSRNGQVAPSYRHDGRKAIPRTEKSVSNWGSEYAFNPIVDVSHG